MKYVNARDALPEELLRTVQRYAPGMLLYVPAAHEPRGWGETSGSREQLACRNRVICSLYQQGMPLQQLAEQFFLSVDSIRKIVYGAPAVLPPFAPELSSALQFSLAGYIEEWVQLWLRRECEQHPPEGCTAHPPARIPLRLIRAFSGQRQPHQEPLLLLYRDRRLHAPLQAPLLEHLRAEKRNSWPGVVLVPVADEAHYMQHYGQHFQPCE